MRQFLCGLLAAALLLSLCACAPEAPSQPENDPPPATEPEGYESVDWLVISLDPEDYGIVYDIDHNRPHECKGLPLGQALCLLPVRRRGLCGGCPRRVLPAVYRGP